MAPIFKRHFLRVQTISADSHCGAPLRLPLQPAARIVNTPVFVAAGMTDNDLLRFGVIAVPSRRKILGILQQAWRWKQARRLDPSSSL